MENSPAVSTMVAADQNTRDLVEEDVGLACPPFDDEDFMAAEASFFDLSEKCFSVESRVIRKVSHTCAERFQGSSGNLNAVQILQKKHGRGKNMKVLEQVYKHKDIAPKDTKDETIESDKKTSTKAAIVDDEVSFENRINLAKRKLQESYANIGQEKKRRQIQVLSLSELPQVKCRPGKHRGGFAHKFASCH
ncbi:glutamic acid-rich protein [Salix suchowensis]|nr:glutamic acid-rich protein [Salix suchowensis]